MKPLYVTLTVRALVNAEALNMAESVGNLVRRKRLPIVVGGENGLEVRLYPVVSGQALAHAYQEILARRAKGRGLPVCKLCEQGVFVKHSDDATLDRLKDLGDHVAVKLLSLVKSVRGSKSVKPREALEFYSEFEESIVASCVVEDIGGFLYTGKVPVRRTSRVKFSYMIPSLQAPHAVGVESVVHTRNDPAAVSEAGQAIYNVEMSSALYTFSILLDVSGIGVVHRLDSGEVKTLPDRIERIEAALESLAELILPASFGAKHSRFLPHWEIESIAAAVVEGFRYQLPGGHRRRYIVDAVKRLEGAKSLLGGDYRLVYYVGVLPSGEKLTDEPEERGDRVVKAEMPEEVFARIREWVLEAVKGASGSSSGG